MDLWCRSTCIRIIILFYFQTHWSKTQDIVDDRCFLENGSNRETLNVTENIPVGAIIGQLRIIGDPGNGGNIALHLEQQKGPVKIIPGSKNLTLHHPLDKEGVNGSSSLQFNVICERLSTLDSGFVIPVAIKVLDVNDNKPVFVNAPYLLNISEVTVVGTRVLRGVHAVDADESSKFSTVLYSVLPGQYSDFFDFENEMEGTLVLKKPLDYEKLQKFDVKIRARDTGDPPEHSDTILTVNVLDADDQNPKFVDEKYSTVVADFTSAGTILDVLPKQIKAYDQDQGINASVVYDFVSDQSEYKHFDIDKRSALVKLKRSLNSGHPIYPKTLVVRATQQDNPDRYALTTLTVSRSLDNKINFLQKNYNMVISEFSPRCTIIGILATNRPEEDLKYYVSNKEILNVFAINPRGEVKLRKNLDFEQRNEYIFRVFATDGITNDSASVNITVRDENEWEPRFRYPHYEFFVTDQTGPLDIIGEVEVKDGDNNDKISLFLSGSNASIFDINQKGELRLKNIPIQVKGIARLLVVAKDEARPPHVASVPVTVYLHTEKSLESSQEEGTFENSSLLTGLGALLLFLAVIIFFLVCYIMKNKRRSAPQEGLLPSILASKSTNNNKSSEQKMVNAFEEIPRGASSVKKEDRKISTDRRKPSPKIHPAPQPPFWPSKNPVASLNNKKLNWDDKNKVEDTSVLEFDLRSPSKFPDTTNLTVYF